MSIFFKSLLLTLTIIKNYNKYYLKLCSLFDFFLLFTNIN